MLKQSFNRHWAQSLLLAVVLLFFSCNAFGQNASSSDTGATLSNDIIIGKISFKPKIAYLTQVASY